MMFQYEKALIAELEDFIEKKGFWPEKTGVVAVNFEGTIYWANPYIHTFLGYEYPSLTGELLSKLVPLTVKEKHQKLVRQFFAAPNIRSMGSGPEVKILKHNGEAVPAEIGLFPFPIQGETKVLSVIIPKEKPRQARSEPEHWKNQ